MKHLPDNEKLIPEKKVLASNGQKLIADQKYV